MCGREVMQILATKGTCLEKSHNQPLVKHEIDSSVNDEAMQCRILNYARVHTIQTLKKALFVNGPCYISFPVYNHNVKMWVQHKDEKHLGGHAMTVVGYNKKGFILRNSWGIFWKNQGYCCFPFQDWGCHHEVWTVITPNSYLIPRWKSLSWCIRKFNSFIKWTGRESARPLSLVPDVEVVFEEQNEHEENDPKLEDIFPEPES
jgi:hypothetical protein